MSLTYSPSDGAAPDKYWGPKFLSNRDITGQAPIDKTPYPAVQVTPACHSDGVYDVASFQTCFSNLLAVGFRRLAIDIYWSSENQYFQLCPVDIPPIVNGTEGENTSAPPHMPPRRDNTLQLRQTSESSNATIASSVATSNATASITASSTASAQPTTTTGESGNTLITLGQYKCGEGLSLSSVVSLIDDYIDASADSTTATLQILEFNLHSAASSNDPSGPPQNVSLQDLPGTTETVGYSFYNSLNSQIYSPGDLIADRANLNLSWYQVRTQERLPIIGYFETSQAPDGKLSTENGWPSELYLLLSRLERLILLWGTIDPEMDAYNFTQDSQWIFPSNYLSIPRLLEQDQSGLVTSGCFYSDTSTSVSVVNNTWAVHSINSPNDPTSQPALQNLTACGITPFLNTTLNSTTSSAATNFLPYKLYTQSLLIGWAANEPTNTSSPNINNTDHGPADQYRCVVLDSSPAYRGKWRVISCQNTFRAACRIHNSPYAWRLSEQSTDYTSAPSICPEGSSFDIPVTQLENTYLYNHILSYAANQSEPASVDLVWINLNSLDSPDCWVTTGPNGTCRYHADADEEHNRQVLIPTIAALIVLILTVLTILVKCNVNRRNSRRGTRTGPGGWEYEGVPS